MSDDTPAFLVSHHDGLTTITFNRPDALNALSPAAFTQLSEQIRTAATDRSCRAIVLTGSGRGFCVGIDVKGVAARDAASSNDADALDPVVAQIETLHVQLSGVIRAIHTLPVPVIAAVNGFAIGAGFAIAAACDLRIASDAASFADGFVKRGISGCEMGLSYFLPRIISPAAANELMLTGRRISAAEAQSLGLVSRVVPAEELLDAANALGEEIVANAPLAISMTKEVMWANLQASSLDHALALESRTQTLVRSTADAREARQAFLERRDPQFGTPTAPRPLQ